jgi:hypothetical protein
VSTYHGFRCKTCDEESGHDLKSGVEALREVAGPALPHVLALRKLGWGETEWVGGWHRLGDLPDFAAKHHEHELVIVSEYGEEFPVESPPPSGT